MRHLFTAFLSTATIAAVLSAAPVAAQVPGNPGAPVTPTIYMNEYWAPTQGSALGYNSGPFFPFGAVVSSIGAMGAGVVGAPTYAAQPHARCRIVQDFNGRYTSLCGP